MFTPQQQLQQQLLQLQNILNQQQRHQQQAPSQPICLQPQLSVPHQGGRSVQQQLLNVRSASQPSILNANPMLQQTLFMQQMQGNMRGFKMTGGPPLHPFFSQAARPSVLGVPVVRVSVPMKPTRLGFPNIPFTQQTRVFYKDNQRSSSDRKRELEQASASRSSTVAKNQGGKAPDGMDPDSETSSQANRAEQPATKRVKLKSPEEETGENEGTAASEQREVEDTEILQSQKTDGSDLMVKPKTGADEDEMRRSDCESSRKSDASKENKNTELLSTGGSLKVTIQQCSESRAISTTVSDPGHKCTEQSTTSSGVQSFESVRKFFCYICNMNCFSQQNFKLHMSGIHHQQRLLGIQQMSSACLVSLLPKVRQDAQSLEQAKCSSGERSHQQKWCSTCQAHFSGDLIKHRRTQVHKLSKHSLRPFCVVCSRHFRTPRKFVEHMKSPEHKQKAKEAKFREQGGPEDSEKLITLDAVGCFEEADENGGVSEEDEGSGHQQVRKKDSSLQAAEGGSTYNPNTFYGPEFVVPVTGFLCRLCHKFCHSESAVNTHCKSRLHFECVQTYKKEINYAAMESQSRTKETSADNELVQGEDNCIDSKADDQQNTDENEYAELSENGNGFEALPDKPFSLGEGHEQGSQNARETDKCPVKDEKEGEILVAADSDIGNSEPHDNYNATGNGGADYQVESAMVLEAGETDVESNSCSQEQVGVDDDSTVELELENAEDLSLDRSNDQEVEIDESKDQEVEIDESKDQEVEIDESKDQEVEIDESKDQEVEIDESKDQDVEINESKDQEVEIDESKDQEVEIDESKDQEVEIDESTGEKEESSPTERPY
ncbi:cip1-interacting zinc finger protein isoform X2 [Protopterus annectens]|uniref:cip1-interacting zinc finger protein isoform X2 n=1 Tax=Protopterus annectens TaxID=7888 RepID=UPI001CFAF7C0|nr:cip1-interacting zinc finger protein isoform X2 [Protopterus annectens]